MATYEYEKLWLEYEANRMDMEMAFGHTLQHVGKLYEAHRTVVIAQRALQTQITALASEIKGLHGETQRPQNSFEVDRLQKLADSLTTCKRALISLRADVDHLLAHTRLPPNPKGKAKPSSPDEAPDPEQPR